MSEFVFGTLSTLERRMVHKTAQLSGVKHLNRLEPRAPRQGDAPQITVTVELPLSIERIVCLISQPEPAIIELKPYQVDWDLLNWSYYQTWHAILPAQADGSVVRYTILAYPAGGGDAIPADDSAVFSYLVGDPAQPEWAAKAIIYQIFPERFHPGHDREWRQPDNLGGIYGGTLRGIIDNLDYVADLGFNCIWLNPFFPDKTHHGYHATDYFSVNPRLGTAAEIHELLDKAHAAGIRLLLDFVANHWGSGHSTFQEAQRDPNSDYVHWYRWQEWPYEYETFFGVKDLPQVNVDYPAARQYLLDAARYWLTEFDFDGYRLDYALGPTHDFWTDFRAAVKSVRPDAWIFGEVVESPVAQLSYEGRLDGCLDFLLMQALRNTFAFGTMSLTAFDNFLNQHETFFPNYFSRPTFLDNHDMNRFLWLVKGDSRKLKLAALCQFALTGPPIVYYGTEIGLSQERDIVSTNGCHIMEESRQPMLWGEAQDRELHSYYRWLVQFRRRHPALWRGRRQTIHLDEASGTYAFIRQDENDRVIVALNLSEEAREFTAAGHTFRLSPWEGDVAD